LIAASLTSYRIGGEVGRGGWGVVLEGTHRQLGRTVAIKQLPMAFGVNESVRARFLAEARVLASMDHPHIVPVYDYVEREGLCLLVMEWLSGGTVWDRFRTTGTTPEESCAIAMATCAALQYAHERGVLHRDVKPENLLFTADNVMKVTDFGIAKVIGGNEAKATRAGEVLGTPAYMAPEQAQGSNIGPQADVYSTGTMLYELISGRLPFAEDTDALGLLVRRVYEPPAPIHEVAPNVSEPLAAAIMRALSTSPEDRYGSAEEFGMAVAEAATATWGPGWPDRVRVKFLGAGPILEATRYSTRSSAGHAGAGAPVIGAHLSMVGRAEGANVHDKAPADLIPVREAVTIPPRPHGQLVAALALLLAAAVLALVGVGGPQRSRSFENEDVTIAGRVAAEGRAIPIDLSRGFKIVARPLPARARDATSVRATFSVLGLDLASSTQPLRRAGRGGRAAFRPSTDKFFVVGRTTGGLEFLRDDTVEAAYTFSADSTNAEYFRLITVPGAASVGLFLFVIAYSESLLGSMRRGRRHLSGIVGMAGIGSILGIDFVAAAWLLGVQEPTLATVVICALLSGGAGIAAALAAGALGKRRRLLRLMERDSSKGSVGAQVH
jgi:serine/threonine-protein kinase